MKQILLVGIGGFFGAIARFGVVGLNTAVNFYNIPIGTLLVNVVGSLIIGLLFGFSVRFSWLTQDIWLLSAVGFCGGFTTFSSFSLENIALLTNGNHISALLNILLSVILGLIALFLGIALSKL